MQGCGGWKRVEVDALRRVQGFGPFEATPGVVATVAVWDAAPGALGSSRQTIA
jgi:hypothetical protein